MELRGQARTEAPASFDFRQKSSQQRQTSDQKCAPLDLCLTLATLAPATRRTSAILASYPPDTISRLGPPDYRPVTARPVLQIRFIKRRSPKRARAAGARACGEGIYGMLGMPGARVMHIVIHRFFHRQFYDPFPWTSAAYSIADRCSRSDGS